MLTPAMVHLGQAPEVLAKRQVTLAVAYDRHPERFVHGPPQPPTLPDAVWINPPKTPHLAPGEVIDSSVIIATGQFSPDSG